ncbi:MAG: N-formylglutamate deformylase [Pseudomonadota bacterium]|nr:N-formylglutamate deformylase [Pseudomonadota bacterium]
MIEVVQGDGPILLGLPHTGTDLPAEIAEALNDTGRALADTDWHIDRLYGGLLEGVSTVRTPVHRYAIDVNRGPDGASLYPGQNTTGLCPLTDFDGRPIYREGMAPDGAEIERRRLAYHAPYHAALAGEIARIKAAYGICILYDCHSIRSEIPFLFPNILPDFNIGTNSGETCAGSVEKAVENLCATAPRYTHVVNGRFKGGFTTRHYGNPGAGVHAIQMELAQSTYMDETPPWRWNDARADRLRPILKNILNTLQDLAHSGELR